MQIISKYELNKSCWKLNFEWKKCKIDLSSFKIGDLAGGVRSDPSRTDRNKYAHID